MRIDSTGTVAARVPRGFGVREALELSRAAAIRRQLRALRGDDDDRLALPRLVALVDRLRGRYGVEAVCAELPITAQQYYAEKSRTADQRWRRLLANDRDHRSCGSNPMTNSRPIGIRTLEPSNAVPTG